eukprot:gene35895-17275_t
MRRACIRFTPHSANSAGAASTRSPPHPAPWQGGRHGRPRILRRGKEVDTEVDTAASCAAARRSTRPHPAPRQGGRHGRILRRGKEVDTEVDTVETFVDHTPFFAEQRAHCAGVRPTNTVAADGGGG